MVKKIKVVKTDEMQLNRFVDPFSAVEDEKQRLKC